jgi:L-aspartate oxidase
MARDGERLAEAEAVLGDSVGAICETVADAGVPELELANLETVAALIAHAALVRSESRGCHYRLDHKERDDARWSGHTVMRRGEPDRFVPVGSTTCRED